ncbi:hypothetical protein ACFODZ_10265 [Marinicella sediminis]|uniref:Uncharacterized protein n=1 Tax=Marinicella sediminis TaxID=1792834 RepID=A0ABV7JCN7_9GAMM|nr:hypothetical protein [Marinicella sediminis]
MKALLKLTSMLLTSQLVNAEPFGNLHQLAGHCWQADFPDGKKTDTHCFSLQYGGAFIVDNHVVCGPGATPYHGSTWYARDAETGGISYHYYNSLGMVSSGSVAFAGAHLLFPDETYQQNGQAVVYKTSWTLGEQHYTSVMTQQDDSHEGGWKPVWEMTFKQTDLADQQLVLRNSHHQLACAQP